MKVIMYGTNACPDCVNAETILKEKNIQYLKLRDTKPLFDSVKEKGAVGIPCFQLEDGTLTLDIEDVLKKACPTP